MRSDSFLFPGKVLAFKVFTSSKKSPDVIYIWTLFLIKKLPMKLVSKPYTLFRPAIAFSLCSLTISRIYRTMSKFKIELHFNHIKSCLLYTSNVCRLPHSWRKGHCLTPVSYTHRDVYKRQPRNRTALRSPMGAQRRSAVSR